MLNDYDEYTFQDYRNAMAIPAVDRIHYREEWAFVDEYEKAMEHVAEDQERFYGTAFRKFEGKCPYCGHAHLEEVDEELPYSTLLHMEMRAHECQNCYEQFSVYDEGQGDFSGTLVPPADY